jgi:hypothetical protein
MACAQATFTSEIGVCPTISSTARSTGLDRRVVGRSDRHARPQDACRSDRSFPGSRFNVKRSSRGGTEDSWSTDLQEYRDHDLRRVREWAEAYLVIAEARRTRHLRSTNVIDPVPMPCDTACA